MRIKSLLMILTIMSILASCESEKLLSREDWKSALDKAGKTTDDQYGNVLIIGGTPRGPEKEGGQAQWTLNIADVPTGKIRLRILTNGIGWYGKGIHSLKPGGTAEIYLNDILIESVICETLGKYDDYWPKTTPAGSSHYDTNEIDLSALSISGTTLKLKIVAKPYTAVDVNAIEIYQK